MCPDAFQHTLLNGKPWIDYKIYLNTYSPIDLCVLKNNSEKGAEHPGDAWRAWQPGICRLQCACSCGIGCLIASCVFVDRYTGVPDSCVLWNLAHLESWSDSSSDVVVGDSHRPHFGGDEVKERSRSAKHGCSKHPTDRNCHAHESTLKLVIFSCGSPLMGVISLRCNLKEKLDSEWILSLVTRMGR